MPHSLLTASIRTVRAVVSAAEVDGVSADELLSRVSLDREALEDVDARVPYLKLATIYTEAARMTGDDAFGLHAGQRIPPGGMGLVEYISSNTPTLGDAYERTVRYFRLLVDGVDVELEREGDVARFVHRFPAGAPAPPRHASEFVMSSLVHYGRRFTGRRWRPLRVRFPHARPESIEAHEAHFGCPIEFGRPAAEFQIAAEMLDLPNVAPDPSLLAILDRHAQDLLAQLPAGDSFANQVRALISQRLRGTAPTLDDIASEIGVSPRTLQRRLKDEATSHQALLDEIRNELSVRYLHDDNMAISEVAFLLGFSEPSAFHRAFRRWTGVTPAEYRRRAA